MIKYDRKIKKLIGLYQQGKTLSCDKKWTSQDGECGTIMVSMWKEQKKIKYRIEKYLDKYAFSEDLYEIDHLSIADDIEDFNQILSSYGFAFSDLHG